MIDECEFEGSSVVDREKSMKNILQIKHLRNIFLVSLLMALSIPTVIISYVYPSFTSQLIQNTENEAVRVGNHMMSKVWISGELSSEAISHEAKDIVRELGLMKIKVFSSLGKILFSNDSKDIGYINYNSYFWDIVAKGNVHTLVVEKNQRTLEGRELSVDVVETYIPIIKGGEFKGAIEIYYDITERKQALDRLLFTSVSIIILLEMFLMIALILVLKNAGKNIVERLQAEAHLKKAIINADAAVTAKSEFLANMSHEFRTPMNGIVGMSEIILDSDLDDELRECAETLKNSGMILMTLINDILDYSKIEAGKLELEYSDFELETVFAKAMNPLAVKAGDKRVMFNTAISPETPSLLHGDPGRLSQIMINLVDNAVKFTEEGEVDVYVKIDNENSDYVKIRFTVTDTGIGIPDQHMGLIFQVFSQVDGSSTRRFDGTGLGLAISKRLSEMMGGHIGVESKEGLGSKFWFTATFRKQVEDNKRSPALFPGLTGQSVSTMNGYAASSYLARKYVKP